MSFDVSQLTLGTELITNGDFASGTTGWDAYRSSTISNDAGRLLVTGGGLSTSGAQHSSGISIVSGSYYLLCFDIVSYDVFPAIVLKTESSTSSLTASPGFFVSVFPEINTFHAIFMAVETQTLYLVFRGLSSGQTFRIDNVSLKEVTGVVSSGRLSFSGGFQN